MSEPLAPDPIPEWEKNLLLQAEIDRLTAQFRATEALDLDAIRAREDAASEEVSRLCAGPVVGHGWRMSIPADERRDSDLIISASLADIPKLTAEVARLREKLDKPCGSCHPCTEWANQTWINAGERLPHVIEWQDLKAELARLRAAEQRVRALVDKVISEQNSAASEYADVRWENGRQNVAHAILAALGGAEEPPRSEPAERGEG